MKTLLILIPLIFLSCLSCQPAGRVLVEPEEDVEADIQAIKDKISQLNASVNAADLDKLVSLYGDDAVRIPPNESPSFGKDDIRKSARQMFDNMSPREEKDVVESVQVSGNLAVAHVKWSSLITPTGGSEHFDVGGDWILVFKREPGNSWKIAFSIWNDETLVHPGQME